MADDCLKTFVFLVSVWISDRNTTSVNDDWGVHYYQTNVISIMQSSVLSLLRVRVLAVALAIVGAGAASLLMVSSAFAAAPNGFTSQTYLDNDGNGAIDRAVVVVNGGEALTSCVVTDAEVTTDWTYVGGATFGGSLTTTGNQHSCVTGTATATFVITGATAGVTGGGTAPTIAHDNDDADNSIANASGNLGTIAAQNLADGAAPQIKTFTYLDDDVDGKIDKFLLTYTETTHANSVIKAQQLSLTGVGDFTAAAFGSATTDIADGGTSDPVSLGTESTARDTAEGAGTIAISTILGDGTFSLTDGTNAQTSVKAQSQATFVDGAAPQIKTGAYSDEDGDAKIDTITLGFTETVTAASVLDLNDLLLTGVGDFTALAFGTNSDDTIAGSVASVALTLGTESSAQDTNEGAGTIAISSQNTFSLTDGTNTNSTLGAQTQMTFVDGARPMLLTSSPANLATNVSRSASIVLTFSEAVSSVTWTAVGGPTTSAFTASGTNEVTLSHTDLFSSGYHSVDITAAPDATSNTFNGAVAAIADPFSFTVMSSSSSTNSTSTSTEDAYDIGITSPNGGEELVHGSTHEISWDSESTDGAMAFVNINLSYTENGSTVQTTIVSGTANDGSYVWTVPDISVDDASIQIVGTDLIEALATDSSDATFAIGSISSDSGDDVSDDTDTSAPSSGETGISPVTGEVEDISSVSCGDYIRSSYFSTVYYLDCASGDMVRRPFLDAQTFKTWQSNWNGVDTVTDATLPTITLGSPMLPKSGVVLVKIQSDARVFAIEGDGTIRWITSESVAIANFGTNWADYVIDVSATLFPRFTQGDDLDTDEDGDTGIMKTRATVNS